MRARYLLLALLATSLSAAGWNGDQTQTPVPPTAAARQSAASQQLLLKTPVERLKPQELVLRQEGGDAVKLSVRVAVKGVDDAQLWEYRWEPGAAWGPGTWVMFRDGLGRLRELRIVVLAATTDQDHRVAGAGTWVRLSPVKDAPRTRLDLFLAGRLVTGGWEIPGTLEDVIRSDDEWLWRESASQVDWAALMPLARLEDARVDTLQQRLRKTFSSLPAVDHGLWLPEAASRPDGTDATGAPKGRWAVLPGDEQPPSRGLGPWGVSHWLATAAARGWGGAPFQLADLLLPRSSLPGYSQALVPGSLADEPSFNLDWIRNLGLGVAKARYPSRSLSNAGADVGSLPYLDALDDTGFSVDDFAPLMHLLAVTKPGRAYLASLSVQNAVSGAAASVAFGPPTVVLPWVGPDGDVRVALFQGTRELTREQWVGTGGPKPGVRADHVLLVELPLPSTLPLGVLPLR